MIFWIETIQLKCSKILYMYISLPSLTPSSFQFSSPFRISINDMLNGNLIAVTKIMYFSTGKKISLVIECPLTAGLYTCAILIYLRNCIFYKYTQIAWTQTWVRIGTDLDSFFFFYFFIPKYYSNKYIATVSVQRKLFRNVQIPLDNKFESVWFWLWFFVWLISFLSIVNA